MRDSSEIGGEERDGLRGHAIGWRQSAKRKEMKRQSGVWQIFWRKRKTENRFTTRTQRRRERQTGESLYLVGSVLAVSMNVYLQERLSASLRSLRETVFVFLAAHPRRFATTSKPDEHQAACFACKAASSQEAMTIP
jgi:hypothetical protein